MPFKKMNAIKMMMMMTYFIYVSIEDLAPKRQGANWGHSV